MAKGLRGTAGRIAITLLASIAGVVVSIILSTLLTIVLSGAICLGVHPEAAMAAEWAAPILGLVWAGALVRRVSLGASLGAGIVVGLAWALAWLYLVGRFDPGVWAAEAFPRVSFVYALAWVCAPILALAGGLAGGWRQKAKHAKRAGFHAAILAVLATATGAGCLRVDPPGKHRLAPGVELTVSAPTKDGTTARLLTFDFRADPRLEFDLYDCDSDDSQPYDDANTSYFGTPAISVFEKRRPRALCVVNAGFFTWTKKGRIGSHVAPVVHGGVARYDLRSGPDEWTFGCKVENGVPRFRLLQGTPFDGLAREFDTALGHVRPLVADGKPLKLGPGAGVTTLKCSRTSVAWSWDASRLYLLIVRDPDSELASIRVWKKRKRQVGGWDLHQVQRYWTRMGARQALALDGGDSTQIVYRTGSKARRIGSARLSWTIGYVRDRPMRAWVPILPIRHSDAGVMNYLCIDQARRRS